MYDDNNPNICLSLLFRNAADAAEFTSKILQLSFPPSFSWSTPTTPGTDALIHHVYNVSDAEPKPLAYKALLISHSRSEWRYTELFHMYRDIDYAFDRSALRVRFPQVYYTNYISTHVDKLYAAPADSLPHFSHCEKRVGNVPLDFSDEDTAVQFMSALTSGHELVFSRRVHFITTKTPSRFKSTKSNKGAAEVQLWQKANSVRLLSRGGDIVEDKWLSMAVPRGWLAHARDSNRAVLPGAVVERGRKMDMSALVARDAREKRKEGERAGGATVTVAFESVRGRYFGRSFTVWR